MRKVIIMFERLLYMEKIRIMCDAASDITPQEAEQLDVELVRAFLQYDDVSCEEGDISKEDYLQVLLNCKGAPSTAQVTPEKCLNAYKRAIADKVDHLIVVTISSLGSGFYNNANLAITLLQDEIGDFDMKITIIDSMTYTYCYGEPIRIACKMIANGASSQQILDYLEDYLLRVEGVAGVYNLKFAKKSGRISGIAAFAGEILGLKPIIQILSGKVDIISKARGDKAVITEIIKIAKSRAVDIENQDIIIFMGLLTDTQLKELKESVEAKLKPKSYRVELLGASITTNTGPYVCGLTYLGEKRQRVAV